MSTPSGGPATRYETTGGVARITLDRPERRNALSGELLESLGEHLSLAQTARDVRVVVLSNAGNTFCAGADLKEPVIPGSTRYGLVELFALIMKGPRPVVGRIAGHCMGGGVGLAAACDISVAADDAFFGFSEVRRGVAPAVISVVCLPKIRRADAAELFLTGRRVTARRAAEVGLVNRAVNRGDLDEAVEAITAELLSGGPQALAACKRLLLEVPATDPAEAFRWTEALSAELFASEEAKEGMAAFAGKRQPSWAPARR